jgi:hypothetical protein
LGSQSEVVSFLKCVSLYPQACQAYQSSLGNDSKTDNLDSKSNGDPVDVKQSATDLEAFALSVSQTQPSASPLLASFFAQMQTALTKYHLSNSLGDDALVRRLSHWSLLHHLPHAMRTSSGDLAEFVKLWGQVISTASYFVLLLC